MKFDFGTLAKIALLCAFLGGLIHVSQLLSHTQLYTIEQMCPRGLRLLLLVFIHPTACSWVVHYSQSNNPIFTRSALPKIMS